MREIEDEHPATGRVMKANVGWAWLSGAGVALGLAGCASGGGLELQEAGYLSFLTHDTTDIESQALAEGVLVVVGDCIGIESGDRQYLAIFPPDTSADESGVTLPDATVLELGLPVSLGGGFATYDSLGESAVSVIPERCVTEELFFVN